MNSSASHLIRIFCVMAFGGILSSCSGGGNSDQSQETSTQSLGTVVSLDRSNAIMGIDSNRSGIRDDIEKLIDQAPEKNKASLARVALGYQNILVKNSNQAEAIVAQKEMEESIICLSRNYEDWDSASSTLLAATVNTETRYMALAKFETMMNGVDLGDIPEPACEN